MQKEILAKNKKATQKIASLLVEEIARGSFRKALVIGLVGDLGSGKTTFAQGFGGGLGVKEKIKSPTFVLMQIFELPHRRAHRKNSAQHKNFIHLDAYRIARAQELTHLGLPQMFRDPHNIILIEWADRIKNLLPKNAVIIQFAHGEKKNERILRLGGKIKALLTQK